MYKFTNYIDDINTQLQLYTDSLNDLDVNILSAIHLLAVQPTRNEDTKTYLFTLYYTGSDVERKEKIDSILQQLYKRRMIASTSIEDIQANSNISESVICMYLINTYKDDEQHSHLLRKLYARLYELFTLENPHNNNLISILSGANNNLYDEYIVDIGSEHFDLLYFNKKIIKLWKKQYIDIEEMEISLRNEMYINGILQMEYNSNDFENEHIQLCLAEAMYIDRTFDTYIGLSIYENNQDYQYVHPYQDDYSKFSSFMRENYQYESIRFFTTYLSQETSRPISVSLNEYLKTSKYGEVISIDMSTFSREPLLFKQLQQHEDKHWRILNYTFLKPIM